MAKNTILFSILLLLLLSCTKQTEKKDPLNNDWTERKFRLSTNSQLLEGETYLPVYSHIYNQEEDKIFNLTTTISIRNISTTDSLFINKANYYNTEGFKIRSYLNNTVFIKPLETVEIIISEKDKEGGSGANFIFNWFIPKNGNKPLFEAVMISTYGQQGISFISRGIEI